MQPAETFRKIRKGYKAIPTEGDGELQTPTIEKSAKKGDHVVIQIESDDESWTPLVEQSAIISKKADHIAIQIESDDETTSKKKRKKPPNNTLTKIILRIFPLFCSRFLLSGPREFIYSKFLLGMGVGGFYSIPLYLLLIDPLNATTSIKAIAGYSLAVIFGIGWGISRYFRCTCLIMVPNLLGKEGRAFILVLVLGAIYAGPGANIQHNFMEIPRSIGCTTELQVNNTKMIWKIMTTPIKKIFRNIVSRGRDFKKTSKDVKVAFKQTDDEVSNSEGYNKNKEKALMEKQGTKKMSTQKKFELKSLLRCEGVVELGITKCHEWFDKKHAECMRVLIFPIINHILCLPMQMKFLCNVLYLGESWCKKRIPLDDSFGDIFDKANSSVSGSDKGFSIKVVDKKESAMKSLKTKLTSIKDKIMYDIETKKADIAKSMSLIKVLISCAPLFCMFIPAVTYVVKYNKDIRHDNCYVTTYFRQIDARRRKRNQKYVLPLKNGEKSSYIFPWHVMVKTPEMKTFMSEIRQCLLPITMAVLSVIFNKLLIYILDVVRKHSLISYVFASYHHLEVKVGGDTFVAKILQKTIGILNSTSNTYLTSNNEECLPNPARMSSYDYLWFCLPVVGYLCLPLCQVYFYRLRRVIASFYFPKREKRRVLFLYNEQLRKRAAYTDAKKRQIMNRSRISRLLINSTMGMLFRRCTWLRKIIRRHCVVCDRSENKTSYVCPTPECGTVYCRQCWRDMDNICVVCTPYEDSTEAHISDNNYESDY